MKILWNKKLISLSDGSYVAWGIKRKRFFFANKNELKLNCAIIEYYEGQFNCDKKVISDLSKIIAELKKECRRCVHTDCPCILSDFGKDRNGICDHFKDVFDENIELKEAVCHVNPCGEWNDDIHDCEFMHYAMEYGSKLTKAKEIIKELLDTQSQPYPYRGIFKDRILRAEQFLKEVK